MKSTEFWYLRHSGARWGHWNPALEKYRMANKATRACVRMFVTTLMKLDLAEGP